MKILSQTSSKRSPVVLQLREYEGKRLVDIRRYFLDRKSNEYKPTHKGIALNRETFRQIWRAIRYNFGTIEEWLGLDEDEEDSSSFREAVKAEVAGRQSASAYSSYGKRKVQTDEFADRRYPFPYRHDANGAVHKMDLCNSHPLHEKLSETSSETASGLMRVVYLSYFVAMDRTEAAGPGGAFDRENFEHEWDRLLRAYLASGMEK